MKPAIVGVHKAFAPEKRKYVIAPTIAAEPMRVTRPISPRSCPVVASFVGSPIRPLFPKSSAAEIIPMMEKNTPPIEIRREDEFDVLSSGLYSMIINGMETRIVKEDVRAKKVCYVGALTLILDHEGQVFISTLNEEHIPSIPNVLIDSDGEGNLLPRIIDIASISSSGYLLLSEGGDVYMSFDRRLFTNFPLPVKVNSVGTKDYPFTLKTVKFKEIHAALSAFFILSTENELFYFGHVVTGTDGTRAGHLPRNFFFAVENVKKIYDGDVLFYENYSNELFGVEMLIPFRGSDSFYKVDCPFPTGSIKKIVEGKRGNIHEASTQFIFLLNSGHLYTHSPTSRIDPVLHWNRGAIIGEDILLMASNIFSNRMCIDLAGTFNIHAHIYEEKESNFEEYPERVREKFIKLGRKYMVSYQYLVKVKMKNFNVRGKISEFNVVMDKISISFIIP